MSVTVSFSFCPSVCLSVRLPAVVRPINILQLHFFPIIKYALKGNELAKIPPAEKINYMHVVLVVFFVAVGA